MINYNNNQDQSNQRQQIQREAKPQAHINRSEFEQIDLRDPSEPSKDNATIINKVNPKIQLGSNQQKKKIVDKDMQKSKQQMSLLNENPKKQPQQAQLNYEKHKKIEGQTSQVRLNAKINFILNNAAVNDDLSVSYYQEQIRQSNNSSSDTYSIHSGNKYWREQLYQQTLDRETTKKKIIPQEKIDNLQKKSLKNDEQRREIGKNGFKYLFHQDIEYSPLEKIKNSKIINQNSNQKIEIQNKISTENAINLSKQRKVQYAYQKGKHKEGETKQQRVKNKLGFILDRLQQSSELVSVSYYSERASMQKKQISQQIQKDKFNQQLQASKVQKIQEQVIFAEEPGQNQVQKRQNQQSKAQIQRPIFQELQSIHQDKQVQKVVIIPKQTIDLDKSFKSKNSKIAPKTPKQKILSQSLDKSDRSRIATNKTPISRQRKNSLQQLNQIIAEIEKKSEQYRSAVDNSARGKNKSQAAQHTQSQEIQKKLSIKSARQNLSRKADLSHSLEDSNQEKVQRYSKHDKSEVVNGKSSSNFSAKIQQVQIKEKLQKSITNNRQKSENVWGQQKMPDSQPFQQLQQILSPHNSKRQSNNNDTSSLHKQNAFSPLFKKDNLQEFSQQTQELRDKARTKQNKIKKNKFDSYLKTLNKQDYDQSDLLTQFYPKNKVQFKIDMNKRFNTEGSSVAAENRKYQVLVKRRQEALFKKAKQQSKIDPKSFVFPQSSSGISKQSSMKSNKQSLSDVKLQQLSARDSKNQHFSKLTKNMSFKKDSLYFQNSYFPALNIKAQRQCQESKTTFISNKASKMNQAPESMRRADLSQQKSMFFKEQTQKALAKPPAVKIEFRNLLKNTNPVFSAKTLQAKEKYEKLKKLLQNK